MKSRYTLKIHFRNDTLKLQESINIKPIEIGCKTKKEVEDWLDDTDDSVLKYIITDNVNNKVEVINVEYKNK